VAAVHNGRATRGFLRKEGRPDAVLVMSLRRLGLEPLRILQREGIPSVLTVNDDWPVAYAPERSGTLRGRIGAMVDQGRWWKHTWAGLSVQRVVYLSNAIRREVLARVPEFPVGTVCNQGVNLKSFEARSFRPVGPAPRMLFVGRLHPTKAPEVAIEALWHLRQRGVAATLQIAGAPVHAAYLEELRAQAERLGVAPFIEWLGMVERGQIPSVYRSSDLLLFLSRWEEPQGLTHMEAMASGVPVVAYPLGGAKELLDAHDVAARAEACTGDAVAKAVIELIGDPDRQRGIVAAGLDLVAREASLDHYIDRLAEELEGAAAGQRVGLSDADRVPRPLRARMPDAGGGVSQRGYIP
jgi:glycosyltransferase involved in cell wall biosynthesis